MKKIKISSLVSVIVGLFSANTFSANIPEGIELAKEQVFRQNTHSDPGSLDPQQVQENTAAQIVIDLFEGLIWLDENGEVKPAQASKWTVSEDGKTYTFELRASKWSDGTPVTAYDFVLGWQRAVDPKVASPNADYLAKAHILNAKDISEGKVAVNELGIKAINDSTLVVTLNQVTPYFLQMLAYPTMFPVPSHQIEKFGDNWVKTENLVSNGAYKLKNWSINEKIVAERNPEYWNNDKTVIERSEYLFESSLSSAYNYYRAKTLDLTWVQIEMLPKIQSEYPEDLLIAPRLTTEFYTFNLAKAPFDNEKVRKALYLSLDRSLIAEKIIGLRKPASTFTPPQVQGFISPELNDLEQPIDSRIEKAKKLLKDVGYDQTNPLKFEIFYNKYATHEKVALALASEWKKKLGAEVSLKTMEWKTYLGERQAGNYQLSRQSVTAIYNEPSAFLATLVSHSPENVGKWNNVEFDNLIAKAQGTLDSKERNRLYQQAELIIYQDAPILPIFYTPLIKLLTPNVGGFPINNPQDYVYTKELYIKK